MSRFGLTFADGVAFVVAGFAGLVAAQCGAFDVPTTIDHAERCYPTDLRYSIAGWHHLVPPRGWVDPTHLTFVVQGGDPSTVIMRLAGGGFGGLPDDDPVCIVLDDAGTRCMPVTEALDVLRALPAAPEATR
jgi:hypothetical protein